MKNNKKIVVFAPHPDDETLGCGGSIAKKLSEGYDVIIVVITDGRYAFSEILGIHSDPSPEDVREIRREEVKRAVKILGVQKENLIFLEFEDGTLEKNEKRVEEKISQIIKENSPVEVYFPYEKDVHPDHRATNRAVRNAIKNLGITVRKYQYSISQKYSRMGPIIDILLNIFKHNIVHVDISRFHSVKRAAVREFKSEIEIISSKQQKPLMNNIDMFLNHEEPFYIDK